MKKEKTGILFSFILLLGLASCSKPTNTSKVLLNEVLIENESNFTDDYGQRSGWIEVFNKSFSNIDLAGYQLKSCYKAGDTLTYTIPKGDVLTLVKPRQHALFWADKQPNRGTFHTSLELVSDADNWIGLYDNSGKLLDEIRIAKGIISCDQSYARVTDAADNWEVKSGNDTQHYVTPSTNNTTTERNVKVEKFKIQDQYGYGMAITAMSVVFFGLLVLFISFKVLGTTAIEIGKRMIKSFEEKKHQIESAVSHSMGTETSPANEEVFAAIAMALHEYEGGNIHDTESGCLTIHPEHSEWNSRNSMQRILPPHNIVH